MPSGYRSIINDEEIYDYLLKEDRPVTRPEIVEVFDLPRSTIYDALARLKLKGLVRCESFHTETRGRPEIGFVGVNEC